MDDQGAISIRAATTADRVTVAEILREAARWLEESAQPMWKDNELLTEKIYADVRDEFYFLAECNGEVAGIVKFQLEDLLFWPDLPQQDAAYLHRLAVRRKFAGGAVSSRLMRWAVERTASMGRRYLRLDTEAARPRLRAVYERFGFKHHSDRQVGPYFVAKRPGT